MANQIKIYKVGGVVRDRLLGIKSSDIDYVVTGATVDDMIQRGFKPVGRGFPVFLHPITHDEYALARTERKNGVGYKGFTFYTSPDVTIIQDLARRDITINAIAEDEDGMIIDPFNGVSDIHNKIIRHVSRAFSEDPLRVLRCARFVATLSNFTIAPQTLSLMKEIAHAPDELQSLSVERIKIEVSKVLHKFAEGECGDLVHFCEILGECGVFDVILSEFKDVICDDVRGLVLQLKKIMNGRRCDIDSRTHLILIYFLLHSHKNNTINTLLNTSDRGLFGLLCNLYHVFVNFNKDISPMDILNIFNKLDPLRKLARYVEFKNILMIIGQIHHTQDIIKKVIDFFDELVIKIKAVDCKNLINNINDGKIIKDIINNKKMQIIEECKWR